MPSRSPPTASSHSSTSAGELRSSWAHDYALLARPGNDLIQLQLFRDYATNVDLYPALHSYFRETEVPLLAVWGEGDEIFGPDGATAFRTDLPHAEIHILPGGHFLLESAVQEVAELMRNFLESLEFVGSLDEKKDAWTDS